jgi:hypothetical protein
MLACSTHPKLEPSRVSGGENQPTPANPSLVIQTAKVPCSVWFFLCPLSVCCSFPVLRAPPGLTAHNEPWSLVASSQSHTDTIDVPPPRPGVDFIDLQRESGSESVSAKWLPTTTTTTTTHALFRCSPPG